MGCCWSAAEDDDNAPRNNNKNKNAFSGQGHRLGTAEETAYGAGVPNSMRGGSVQTVPKPIVDSNLNDNDRAMIRAERAKAAEERAKKAGHKPQKKKKVDPSEPLRGPNSVNMMRWTSG